MTEQKKFGLAASAKKGRMPVSGLPPKVKAAVSTVVTGATEVGGANVLGKIAEAAGKVSVATVEHLSVSNRGYNEVLGKLADKADTHLERDAIRKDLNQNQKADRETIKELSEKHQDNLKWYAGMVAFLATGAVIALKVAKRIR